MWEPDGHLVQIEIGNAITNAATQKDQRGIISKFLGDEAPRLGKILTDETEELQEAILKEGKVFPPLGYRPNSELEPNEVLAYMGLEIDRFKVSSLGDILQYIRHNIDLYSSVPHDKTSIKQLLSESLDDLREDNFQDGFEKLQKAYYWGYINGYQHEVIRCLSDTGNIRLKNNDLDIAFALFSRASDLSASPSIVDTNMKSQVALNVASLLRVRKKYQDALSYFTHAANIAFSSGNSPHLFLALSGTAEALYYLGDYSKALIALQHSKNLVLSEPTGENYRIALALQESITNVYVRWVAESQSSNRSASTTSLFDDFMKTAFEALTRSVIQGVVYKLFGVAGGLVISILGTSKYDFGKSIFNAPTAIGDKSIIA